jgi:hypothetical protein
MNSQRSRRDANKISSGKDGLHSLVVIVFNPSNLSEIVVSIEAIQSSLLLGSEFKQL